MTDRSLDRVLSVCLPLTLSALLPLGCGLPHNSGNQNMQDMGTDMQPPVDPRFLVPHSDWQAEHPAPAFGRIRNIFALGPNDAWMVGDFGTVLHWDGTQLNRGPQRTIVDLYKVWSDGPTNVWAIGDAGVVMHYDGADWRPIPIDANAPLTGIWGSAVDDVYVTDGDDSFFSKSGQLFHWNGTSFSKAIADTSSPLFDVYGTRKDDVWAVGYNGTAIHWNGTQWLPLAQVASKDLNAIWGTAANDLWVVGDSGTSFHWNGTSFTSVPTNLPSQIFTGVPDMWAISGFAANDIWGLAAGTYLIHGDGTKWNPNIVSSIDASTVWNRAQNDLWVAGRGLDRYNGTSFTPLLTGTHPILNLLGAGTSDVFAQCEVLLRRDGSGNWNKVTLPNATPLSAMWGSSASDVWVVNTARQFLHFDGSTWLQKSLGSTLPQYFDHSFTLAANDVWIADNASAAPSLWHFNGASFTAYTVVDGSSAATNYGPIWASSATDVWAAGQKGNFYHFDGASWSLRATGFGDSVTWRGMVGTAANDIWFVGTGGKIGHYDGANFSVVTTSVTRQLNSVYAASKSDVWAVGDYGTIAHYDGQTWSTMESGTHNTLNAVWATTSGDVWAAGDNGLLLHLKH